MADISIHAPRTGSDRHGSVIISKDNNFNPRSPHGERRDGSSLSIMDLVFQSTLPARGATGGNLSTKKRKDNFNPRSPHGERHLPLITLYIHFAYFNPRSPHGERRKSFGLRSTVERISIHAPRTGSDGDHTARTLRNLVFQSTLPARGATWYLKLTDGREAISIHAPRTGSDAPPTTSEPTVVEFQSTLPARGATALVQFRLSYQPISIHAPRTGSDRACVMRPRAR